MSLAMRLGRFVTAMNAEAATLLERLQCRIYAMNVHTIYTAMNDVLMSFQMKYAGNAVGTDLNPSI